MSNSAKITTILGDVKVGPNRVVAYFQFDKLTFEQSFAAKKLLNDDLTHIKNQTFNEMLAWVGFDDLGLALLKDPVFSKRYKNKQYQINDTLLINVVNAESCLFYKVDHQWHQTKDFKDLERIYGESIALEIDAVAGPNFCKNFISKIEAEKKLDESLKQTVKELKEIDDKISKGIKDTNLATETLPIKDFEESTVSLTL